MATKAAMGSEWQERRNQRRFGRTIQFCGVTKPGCRNGAAGWAKCSGVPFGRAGVLGKPVFRLTASSQLALGMIGLFIVHPRDPKSQVDHDFAILLSEWKIDVGARRPDPNEMTDFNVLTMNARVFPGTAPL